MRTHSKLQTAVFSGALTAALALTTTQSVVADGLRAAGSADSRSLKSVPGDAPSGIHQVSHSAELQQKKPAARRYGQSSNRAKRQTTGKTNGGTRTQSSSKTIGIRFAQHNAAQQSGQIRQVSDEKEKKSGLFRRIFGFGRDKDKQTQNSEQGGQNNQPQPQQQPLKKTAQGESGGSDDNPYVNSGQPVAKLPPPPPISYQTNSRKTYNSGVPAKPAGYNSNQATPMIQSSAGQPQGGYRQNQGGYAQPQQGYRQPQQNYGQSGDDIPTLRAPVNNQYQPNPAPAPRAAPRQDNFIDPFDNQGEPELLDLDSIARDPRGVASVPANPVRVQPQPPKEELLPELPVQTDVVTQEPPRGPANGPYTGYRLDSDETLLIQPNVSPASNAEVTIERRQQAEAPVQRIEETPDITLPIVEDEIEEPELPAVPVRQDPEPVELEPIALEPDAEPAQDSVPLLDESEMSFPTHQELEEDFQQLEQPEPEQIEEAFESRTFEEKVDISEPELPGAGRLRALDTRAKQEQQRFRIMARSGKFGFKGFCPVALRDTRELIDSRERYKAKFGLQTYYFSSPEAKSAFEANPARYAPSAGGSDVVLLVNTGEDTPGSLDFSLWYRDRLYMFRSRETQAIFAKDPLRFADQY